MRYPFRQVDVFGSTPYLGNPVAVVLDAEDLSDGQMRRFANWTNLSETTFVLPPRSPEADYRLRIFTTDDELPFAGHPTLGSCHAWLGTRGAWPVPEGSVIIQECQAGLVRIRATSDGLAFEAPPLLRSGPVDDVLIAHVAQLLQLDRSAIVDAQWADNGPGWLAVMLESAEAVLAVEPLRVDLFVGIVGPHPTGSAESFEVRAFVPTGNGTVEDPVTGSLNASIGQWLLRTGRVSGSYVAIQGSRLGRHGRIHITADADGSVWVGGTTTTSVTGEVEL